jgi:hypothetical protein
VWAFGIDFFAGKNYDKGNGIAAQGGICTLMKELRLRLSQAISPVYRARLLCYHK